MHRMIVVLVGVAAMGVIPAAAQSAPHWHVAYRDRTVTVSLDTASIVRNGDGSYAVSTRWDYAKPRILESKKSYSRLEEKVQLKCAPVVMKRVSVSLFDRAGMSAKEPEEASDADVRYMSWDAPRKGSDGQRAFAAICRHLKVRDRRR